MIQAQTPRRKPRRLRRRLGLLIALLVALVFLPRLLLATSTPVGSYDALFVFPGEVPDRAECGAALHREGFARVVVFSGGQIASELRALGINLNDAALNARIAEEAGVPRTDEVIIGEGTSTWEDALVLGRWMQETGARRVLAITSPLHSRRALWTLQAALGPLSDRLELTSCVRPYGLWWWTGERSLVGVSIETLKLGFYTLRYFIPVALGFQPQSPPQGPTGDLPTATGGLLGDSPPEARRPLEKKDGAQEPTGFAP